MTVWHPNNYDRHEGQLCVLLVRAIAQAVSRRFPTAAARIRAQARSCGICGGQSGPGAGFFRVLRFPLSIIPSIAPQFNHPSTGDGTIGQIVARARGNVILGHSLRSSKQIYVRFCTSRPHISVKRNVKFELEITNNYFISCIVIKSNKLNVKRK
jgi:hypothetical protein